MAKGIDITIENKLVTGKRDMNVYHHSSKSAHMISYNSSVILSLRPVKDDDYLHVSVVSGPGYLDEMCTVNLPSWLDFEISSLVNVSVSRSGDRTLLKIPPGPPMWQLKMTRTAAVFFRHSSDRVTIGDEMV